MKDAGATTDFSGCRSCFYRLTLLLLETEMH